MMMVEPNGNREKRQPGAFKSAFRAFSPKSETRLAGLDGLSSKFSQWEKYLQDRYGLSEGKEGMLSATARRTLNIAAAKAEFAEGKIRLAMGRKSEKSNDYVKATEEYSLAHSHFSKAGDLRIDAGLEREIEHGMASYSLTRHMMSGKLLGIGDIVEILKTTPDGAVRFVSDAVAELAADYATQSLESFLYAEKIGRKITGLPVAEAGLEAGRLYEHLEEKEKASEIYMKTGDWCAREEKYSDAASAYKKAAAINPLMAKNYLELAKQMEALSRVAGRIKSV
ncbi:MAG: hypothetical protein WCT52_00450 [Candidatus Micrarchaeia archaeon]